MLHCVASDSQAILFEHITYEYNNNNNKVQWIEWQLWLQFRLISHWAPFMNIHTHRDHNFNHMHPLSTHTVAQHTDLNIRKQTNLFSLSLLILFMMLYWNECEWKLPKMRDKSIESSILNRISFHKLICFVPSYAFIMRICEFVNIMFSILKSISISKKSMEKFQQWFRLSCYMNVLNIFGELFAKIRKFQHTTTEIAMKFFN